MRRLRLFDRKDDKLSILCLGAHADDIEIGCGGTILRFVEEGLKPEVLWVVFSDSADKKREAETLKSAEAFLGDIKHEVIVRDFRDGFMPFLGAKVKDYFEQLKHRFEPDLILTHHRGDLHQDHRLISQLTWNTFRNHFILEYEILKYDGGLGSPNFFVPLGADICQKKVSYLLDCFPSQQSKSWFSSDSFYSLLRLRGLECNSQTHYAEAFYGHKTVI